MPLRLGPEDGADYTCSPAGGRNSTVSVTVKEVKYFLIFSQVEYFGLNIPHLQGYRSQAQPWARSEGGTTAAAVVFLSLLLQ